MGAAAMPRVGAWAGALLRPTPSTASFMRAARRRRRLLALAAKARRRLSQQPRRSVASGPSAPCAMRRKADVRPLALAALAPLALAPLAVRSA